MKRPIAAFVSGLLTSILTMTSFGATNPKLINGAGATFPYPIYTKWFSEFQKVSPRVAINYQSIGSGGGIRQLLDGTVDFGASDSPMNDDLLKSSKKGAILHVPTVLGAVAVTYNLPDTKGAIRLTPDLIVDIYRGKVNKWNDPRIVAINSTLTLPDLSILPVYRSDGSGTTAVFTDYLAKVSPEWKSQVGAATSIKWPTGVGGKGNEGVTGVVKRTQGSIGYVELIYAKSNGLPVVSIKNKSGEYVEPTVDAVTAAADASLKSMPEDFRTSITDAEGKKSYPISSYTYLLIYQEMPKDVGTGLVEFLNWAVIKGQMQAREMSYAPLPASLVKKVQAKIKTIKFK